MKNNLLGVALIILTILFIMGVADYRISMHNFKKPIFARLNIDTAIKDGGSGVYNGIGYSIEISGNFMPEDELKGSTHTRFYVLGNEICCAIRY
jgi:hypothetical protein